MMCPPPTDMHTHTLKPSLTKNQYNMPTGTDSVSAVLSNEFIVTLLYMVAFFMEFVLILT